MNSTESFTRKDLENQLFSITNQLVSEIQAHRTVWGNESNDYFLSKIYELEQKWHKIFMQSCYHGGF